MIAGSLFRRVTLVIAAIVALTSWTPAAQQANTEALFQEARRLFDTLDYERALVALDQAIVALDAIPQTEAGRSDRLASAYEMRARSKFGLGDQDGAKADFVLLLKLAPAHTLSGQISPRVVALFEETVLESVTSMTVMLTPATARLSLDGIPIAGPGTIRVVVGEHVISAEQPGYRAKEETVTAVAGTTTEVTLELERVSSVIRITTTPADVEVKMNGVAVARTDAETEGRDAPGSSASATFVVDNVAIGTHTIDVSRDCFVGASHRVEVERPDDYTVGPVVLQPAVATLSVSANQPGAQVFVDGTPRGVAPLKVPDLCEGEHLVELRTSYGSDSRRITVRAGHDLSVESTLRPAFAVVSVSGDAGPGQQDLRVLVERAFAAARTVTLVAPPADAADRALKTNQLTPDWLAIDAAGRPLGSSAQMAGPLRKEVSARLADVFRTQGVASVTMIAPTRGIVALLSAGSGIPDVVEVALDDPASIAAAISRLDRSVTLSRTSLGLELIDVADVPGVVIVGIDSVAAASTTARIGDVIAQADGKAVTDVVALSTLVQGRKPGELIALDLRDAAGGAKRVEFKVLPTPRLIGLSEQGLLANRILLDLRARLADVTDPFEQSVMRLNIAVANARIGNWSAAREELLRVTLDDQPGVGNGTVQYLLGLAAENLGNRSEAETAFTAAAASASLLTEDGPPVKELAQARLAELQKGPR